MSKFYDLLLELGINDDLSSLLNQALSESAKTGRCTKIQLSIGFYPSKKTKEVITKARMLLRHPDNIRLEKDPTTLFYVNGELVRDDQEQMNLEFEKVA